MTSLNVPNSITNGTTADATDVQQNFDAIEAHVNTEVVNRDGSVAMTGELLLPFNPTNNLGASTKSYVDLQVGNEESARITAVSDEASARSSADSTLQANIDALTSSSIAEVGTLTWDQQVVGTVTIPSGQAPPSPSNLGTWNSITINPSDAANESLISRSPASFWGVGPVSPSIQYNYVTENAQYFFVANWNWNPSYISAVGATTGNSYSGLNFYYSVVVGGAGVHNISDRTNIGGQIGYFTERDKNSVSGFTFYPALQCFFQPNEDINVTFTWTDGLGEVMLYKMFSFE